MNWSRRPSKAHGDHEHRAASQRRGGLPYVGSEASTLRYPRARSPALLMADGDLSGIGLAPANSPAPRPTMTRSPSTLSVRCVTSATEREIQPCYPGAIVR